MKKLYYAGLLGLLVFEFLNVYFIMPMPGSQKMNSIDLAYFLYSHRWLFRVAFLLAMALGFSAAWRQRKKWAPAAVLLIVTAFVYLLNFQMSADKMFLQPHAVIMKSRSENKLPGNRLVIGVVNNGEAKAFPVEFLAYHHQVKESVGGRAVLVTYCSVCRTGRVYEPAVNGKPEIFRLVGMDHFNAMFEDATTGSWWRQSTGEAVAGKLKGSVLPEIESVQMTVEKWFELYPEGMVMQPDEAFAMTYDSLARFEQGKSTGRLTRSDTLSWKDKSWVVGVKAGSYTKAYAWNDLKAKNIIHDTIGAVSVVLVLSSDGQSFSVFERPANKVFTLVHDTLFSDAEAYDFSGRDVNRPSTKLRRLDAYQEFWHSWISFHPETRRYSAMENKAR